eukprot:XP_020401068.1 hypersensitive-induced response protein-like protein 2 [Zea mays]
MDLPADVKERELHNLLCWLLGFETSEMNFKGNQPMGFALFSTVHQAITAKAMFQDTVFDAETKVALQTDMAKKNLFVKRSKDHLSRAFAEWVARLPLTLLTTQPQRQCIVPCAFSLSPSLLNNWMRVAASEKAKAEKIHQIKRAEGEEESKYLTGVGIARQCQAIVDGLRDTVLALSENVPGTTPRASWT